MTIKNYYLLIFLIALLATVGSLYYGYFGDPVANIFSGEFFNRLNGLPACDLCWYMRVFQYPIVLISFVALLRKDNNAALNYILPLSILGLIAAGYKHLLEAGIIEESSICLSGSVSCSTPQVEYFGWLGLPLMGVVACFLTIVLCVLIIKKTTHE